MGKPGLQRTHWLKSPDSPTVPGAGVAAVKTHTDFRPHRVFCKGELKIDFRNSKLTGPRRRFTRCPRQNDLVGIGKTRGRREYPPDVNVETRNRFVGCQPNPCPASPIRPLGEFSPGFSRRSGIAVLRTGRRRIAGQIGFLAFVFPFPGFRFAIEADRTDGF